VTPRNAIHTAAARLIRMSASPNPLAVDRQGFSIMHRRYDTDQLVGLKDLARGMSAIDYPAAALVSTSDSAFDPEVEAGLARDPSRRVQPGRANDVEARDDETRRTARRFGCSG
jgi:hypothetical protein